ncbi:MAG: family 20 glycosylhydrolase [Clostridia bacterium]|nr:family 20 glycosylhydrolase [Clostridia bacterium]
MISVIPTPKKMEIDEDKVFLLKTCVYFDNGEFEKSFGYFSDAFERIYESELKLERGGIEFYRDNSLEKAHYAIKTEDNVLKVYAPDKDGMLFAMATVLQILESTDNGIECAEVFIEDYGDKEYRSLMVDLSRKWHPFDKLLRYIDICFLYKVKYLHLHFIDSVLYTLPSTAFPKLAKPNRSYTREQIEFLNDYAESCGIIIVPEFECPGHCPVLVKTYPEVFADKLETQTEGIVTERGVYLDTSNVLCAGSEVTWEATKTLLKEICDMFPESPYINIGGDEVNIKQWNNCTVCKEYMNEHGIADEKELFCEYIGRVTDYVLSLGKTPLVWEGFPKEGAHHISKDVIVISWETRYHLPGELLEEGFSIINCSWQPLYIVSHYRERWDPRDILKWNVYNWQHWWPKSEACLNPITVAPTDKVLGGMVCAWTLTYEQEINFIMENLAAMCERVWNIRRVVDDDTYLFRHIRLTTIASRLIQDR